uniref:Uncharacterized protein n=1 Tax=Arion vulgaris TaxID=1028688 RepID=A0A0B6ZPC8_9EUPU
MANNQKHVIFIVIIMLAVMADCVRHYQYKQYTYRKKRDDKRYKGAQQRCEVETLCHGLWSVAYTKCIRKCMSEFCYNELYANDELEEGEIDVRLSSFKGCLSQVKMEDFF